jgi:ribosomal protein S18 acetylase RimI-like enzyme
MADGGRSSFLTGKDVIVVIREEKFDNFKFGEVNRIVSREESDRYIADIDDMLMESYDIEESPGSMVNMGLCQGLYTSFTVTEGLYDSGFTILVKDIGDEDKDETDLIIGQLSIREGYRRRSYGVGFKLEPSDEILEVHVLCGYPGKKGVGSYLIDKLEEICKANGVKKLVLDSVIPAIGFYEKKGFRTREEYDDETDSVRMTKMVK